MSVDSSTVAGVLRSYGFDFLTGEACAYGMRILTDLTDQAEQILIQFLGVRDITFNGNWNSRSKGSFMIPGEMMPALAVFCEMQRSDTAYVILEDESIHRYYGSDADEEYRRSCRALISHRWFRTYSKKNGPKQGDRMEHVATGRTE